ncbi:MAG: chaperone NapD [Azoarcus sp.]|jgi:nitrate reductase NapD|nr:chaperone NapD [Azoarcus sp.]
MCGGLSNSRHFHAETSAITFKLFFGRITAMKIVSLVLKFMPRHADEIKSTVEAIPGASVAADGGDGRMIVLVEDGPDYAVSDSILQIHQIPQVMSTTLSYEYSDEAHALEEN